MSITPAVDEISLRELVSCARHIQLFGALDWRHELHQRTNECSFGYSKMASYLHRNTYFCGSQWRT